MKNFRVFLIACLILNSRFALAQASLHSYTVNTIKGKPVSMSQFAGKKLLIVNTASYCQYTPQFGALQLLYNNFKQYNFEIIGFPCNDFGAQDPNSDSIISSFCTGGYGVNFAMMSKVKIAIGDTAPIYKWLQRANLNGKMNTSVSWNFGKFLINESGNLVKYLPSDKNPADTAVTNWILSPSTMSDIKSYYEEVDLFTLLSPNPIISGAIEVSINPLTGEKLNFQMMSIEGKVVKVFQLTENQDEVLRVDVSAMESGVYFLKMTGDSKQTTKRILINR